MRNPFRYFNSSPEVIRLAVMMYVRYPLSLRQVEDLLFERGIDICHERRRRPDLPDLPDLELTVVALVDHKRCVYSRTLRIVGFPRRME